VDCRRQILRRIAAAGVLLAAACASAPDTGNAPNASDIRALLWIASGADRVKALTERPAPCVRIPHEAPGIVDASGVALMKQQDVGRLAFDSPALIGGAAGRMGLSCSSCHLNGRGNPDFFIEGMSREPGTADVTSSLLSKVRGNGVFDPVVIPDLAARDGRQIRHRTGEAFRTKVHGLVVEEFDGQEPPPAVWQGLLLYLDALTLEGCDPTAREPVLAGFDQRDAMAALSYAQSFADEGEQDDALLMARIARTILERMHERFVAIDQSDVRDALVEASRQIAAWADQVRSGGAGRAPRETLDRALSLVEREAPRSLYEREVLRAALHD
jgi:hypothetical protein